MNNSELERYLLGELPEEKMQELAREIASNPELSARVDAMKKQNEQLFQSLPPEQFARQLRGQLRSRKMVTEHRRLKTLLGPQWTKVALAVCSVVIIGFFLPNTALMQQRPDTTRLKGLQPKMHIFLNADDHIQELDSGAHLSEGQLIQIGYNAAGMRYGAIFSLDGNGVITPHLCDSSSYEQCHAQALQQSGVQMLSSSYQLDDAPEFEAFFFISAQQPFTVPLEQMRRQAEVAQIRESMQKIISTLEQSQDSVSSTQITISK